MAENVLYQQRSAFKPVDGDLEHVQLIKRGHKIQDEEKQINDVKNAKIKKIIDKSGKTRTAGVPRDIDQMDRKHETAQENESVPVKGHVKDLRNKKIPQSHQDQK